MQEHMKMKRIQKIEEYIQEHKHVSLNELCTYFNVSKNTIRRDIQYLETEGLLEKVYGGVIVANSQLIPFESRTIENKLQKELIAAKAASLIEENDLIFIDSGTTTSHLLDSVSPAIHFTVLTNNLDIINSAATMTNINLVVVGTTFKRRTRSFVELSEETFLSRYNINKAFMAATGVSIAHGLTNSDPLEYEIKKWISAKTNQLYLLADPTKFDKSTLLTYLELSNIDGLITTNMLPHEYQHFCKQHHIPIYYPLT